MTTATAARMKKGRDLFLPPGFGGSMAAAGWAIALLMSLHAHFHVLRPAFGLAGLTDPKEEKKRQNDEECHTLEQEGLLESEHRPFPRDGSSHGTERRRLRERRIDAAGDEPACHLRKARDDLGPKIADVPPHRGGGSLR